MRALVVTVLAALSFAATGHAQSRSVIVGDAVINYEITGQGEALVLIHGWAQDLTIWDHQAQEFGRRNYRVIVMTAAGLANRPDTPMRLQTRQTFEFSSIHCTSSRPRFSGFRLVQGRSSTSQSRSRIASRRW
jgi:hypothetical protein